MEGTSAGGADEIGADRTGLWVWPGNPYDDIVEHDMHQVFPALLAVLAPLNLTCTRSTPATKTFSRGCARMAYGLLLTVPALPSRPGSSTSMPGWSTSSPSPRPLWPTRTCQPVVRRTPH
ncbi:hypothetical protein [Streptomyces sp. AM6-12]|uniref:hypothetical protein n=1 Tax=Streptomyces sp. AM6-12 TaxID=3345149 RepID=UPI0037939ADB